MPHQTIVAPMPGVISQVKVIKGNFVEQGATLAIIEIMKMESLIKAEHSGVILEVLIEKGTLIEKGEVLFRMDSKQQEQVNEAISLKDSSLEIRPDLQALFDRKAHTLDQARQDAVSKRKNKGFRTARENIEDLCDSNTFHEYGSLIIAAQRNRRKLEDLIQNTPADGIITGIGNVNSDLFGKETSKCMILAYDYMVLAGTQGMFGHKKTDRMLRIAEEAKLPIVLFAEGGGGRPGDTDFQGIGGLDVMTFSLFPTLNGIVPRVAIVAGYCFAGNAALAGCADVIIATKNSSIGMGGPAMIEGGGLGKFHPKEVGPSDIQSKNGVIDILVEDEEEAVRSAQKYLGYFQGRIQNWRSNDQLSLRNIVPQNRRLAYDIYGLIQTLADVNSVLELRRAFAPGIITAFIRVEGYPLGLIANNPHYLGGAIDSQGADKAARFMQLCNAFGIPLLSLCDTPGIMVGPEAETSGTVRHAARLFTIGASLRIPIFTIVVRKAYGLGSMAMAGGSMHKPFFTVSWPTGEFGGMGLEGAVRLGYRKELEAIPDPDERKATFEKMVEKAYQHGKAINTASYLEIDEVIDPKTSREWILMGLEANPKKKYMNSENRFLIDNW